MALKARKKVQEIEPKIEIKEEENMWGYEVRVTAERLRIREEPSAGAKVVGLI